MSPKTAAYLGAALVVTIVFSTNLEPLKAGARGWRNQHVRTRLREELRPVAISNCTLARFGHPHDGGYLACANLLSAVTSAYSYGIEGRDEWGCAIAKTLGVPVHQYDCFDNRRPICENAQAVFHDECISGVAEAIEGRSFDSLAHQIARNGDQGKRLIVKMDVEGAEWDALLRADEATLQSIDQLVIEFHGTELLRYLAVIRKLKRTFVVANLHFNNFTCGEEHSPLPARVWEVLMVNKALAVVDPTAPAPPLSPFNSPNIPDWADCQK